MSFKNIDYLSPEITLFYYGNSRHTTICGAFLTLLLLFISAIYIFYLMLNISNHELSSFVLYRNYITDIVHYYFNESTGIFHYFQIYDTKSRTYGEYNSKYIRIFISRISKEYQENKESLYENEHWVYDFCRQGIDNNDIEKEIFEGNTTKDFEMGACLRYYYNNINYTYYPIEDKENFKYPYLSYEEGNNNNEYLGTVIEKCDNSSIMNMALGPCGLQNDIDEYFEKYKGIYLQLLDKKLNVNNYKSPVYQYLYPIEENLNIDSIYVNNINLIPFDIEIKTGIAFPRTKRIKTYSFEDRKRTTYKRKNNNEILSIFNYRLKNTGHVIKGRYITIFDILPNIGGFIHLLYFIFYFLNYLFNKYITIIDTNNIFFRMSNVEDPKDSHIKKIFLNDITAIRDEAKYREDSRLLAAMEKRDSIFITKKAKQKKKSYKSDDKSLDRNPGEMDKNNNNHNLSNSNELICNKNNNNLGMNNITVIKTVNPKHVNNNNCEINNEKLYIQFSAQIKEYINRKNKTLKYESLKLESTPIFINTYNFFMSLFKKNKDKYGIFFIFDKFRKKILGEEHFYKANIILYHLEKYFDIKEEKKIDIMELYENL